jgi:hypothetical protein
MRTRADLESIWRFCTHHRDLLARSERAGCFFCASIFPPSEIREWIDEPPSADGRPTGAPTPEGVTALCPRCGIDSVLPSATVPLDEALLTEMGRHFFGETFRPPAPETAG